MTDRQRVNILIAALQAARQTHYYCEDCWYSCPLAEGGCCDPAWPKGVCNCGAAEHNAAIDDAMQRIGYATLTR